MVAEPYLFKQIPKLAQWDVIRPSFEPALEDPKRLFHEAVRDPIGTKPLREIVTPSDRVVIATSDGTRPVPNKQLIPWSTRRTARIPRSRNRIDRHGHAQAKYRARNCRNVWRRNRSPRTHCQSRCI